MEIKATALAAEIAGQHGITRQAAYDMLLAAGAELAIPAATRYAVAVAAELERLVADSIKAGKPLQLTRRAI